MRALFYFPNTTSYYLSMSYLGVLERRFREGRGETYLKNDPNKIRCQACSKGKLKTLRLIRKNPDLTCDDVWPEAQCVKAAEPGTYGCILHGGRRKGDQVGMLDFIPSDFRHKAEIFQANSAELLNRTHEIAYLKARNAELFESSEDLVVGEEGWLAVKEALDKLRSGEVLLAQTMLEIALRDSRSEREIWFEMRENDKLIDKLTNTHFSILEKLKLMTTMDQMRQLLEGIYRVAEIIFERYIEVPELRAQAMRDLADGIRNLTNTKAGALTSGDK